MQPRRRAKQVVREHHIAMRAAGESEQIARQMCSYITTLYEAPKSTRAASRCASMRARCCCRRGGPVARRRRRREHPAEEDVSCRAGDDQVGEVALYCRQRAPDAVLHDEEESHADGKTSASATRAKAVCRPLLASWRCNVNQRQEVVEPCAHDRRRFRVQIRCFPGKRPVEGVGVLPSCRHFVPSSKER